MISKVIVVVGVVAAAGWATFSSWSVVTPGGLTPGLPTDPLRIESVQDDAVEAPAAVVLDPPPPSLDRMAVPNGPPAVAPPPNAMRRLRRAFSDGAVPGLDVRLPDAEAWDRFSTLWDELGTAVRRAEDRRDDIGRRLSRDQFAKGESARIPDDGLQKSPDGHARPIGVWSEKRHPQEWVSTRCSFREGEGQLFEQVRIMPGESQELDEASLEWALAIEMRTEAVKRFFANHMLSTPSESPVSRKDGSR